MIFMPLWRLLSIISSVTAFFRCDRCSCRTQLGNARPFVSYLPLVRSLKKFVMTYAFASPLLFRTMSRNSGNSIIPEPSSSTSYTSFSTSSNELTRPSPISGPLISSTPIDPELSSSRLLKHSFRRRIWLAIQRIQLVNQKSERIVHQITQSIAKISNLLVFEVKIVAFALLDQPLAAALFRDFERFRPVVSLAVHPLFQETFCTL